MKRTMYLFIGIVILWSCAKEGMPEKELFPPLASATKSYLISMDSLQTLALELPGLFGEEPGTRSAERRMIAGIEPLGTLLPASATRSGEGEDLTEHIYVVNYDDDAGFAILSADNRLETILAYSGQGNLTDTTSNPGVHIFMEMIPGYVEEQLALRDSSLIEPEGPEYYMEVYEQISSEPEIKGPFVPVKWSQYAPFNEDITFHPLAGCTHPPAGCVAIAMLQIMAAHRHPDDFYYHSWYSCNWTRLRSFIYPWQFIDDPNDAAYYDWVAISKLTHMIGEAVDMTYGCSGSSARTAKANTALRDRFSYRTDGVYSYHLDRIVQDIDNGRPVYTSGFSVNNWFGHSGGHAWVVDGYRFQRTVHAVYWDYYDSYTHQFLRREYKGTRTTDGAYWVHCNWGWGGLGDGYYANGVFNTGFPEELDTPGWEIDPADYTHYRYKLEVIKNVRP